MIARDANAGKLIVGHYSSRYQNLNDFKLEAETVFGNVEIAQAGKKIDTA